jgi:hypothetical protein
MFTLRHERIFADPTEIRSLRRSRAHFAGCSVHLSEEMAVALVRSLQHNRHSKNFGVLTQLEKTKCWSVRREGNRTLDLAKR